MNLKIYNSDIDFKFKICNFIKILCNHSGDYIIPVKNNFFICNNSEKNIKFYDIISNKNFNSTYNIFNRNFELNENILIGYIDEKNIIYSKNNITNNFYNQFFNESLKIIKNAYKILLQHLENRYFENEKIIKFAHIQNRFSAIIENTIKIENLILCEKIKETKGIINSLFSEIFENLILLSGGRGFLEENICEFKYYYELIYKIYGE
jgi:hypothetical protein